MMNTQEKIRLVESGYVKKNIPSFKVGDTVAVHVKVVEEGKTRIQVFEGIVIAKKGSGIRETFTVRKVSFGEGVERVFPLHSPSIEKIAVIKHGQVRRAKIYYLRERVGKSARIKEKLAKLTQEITQETTPTQPSTNASAGEKGQEKRV